MDEFDVFEMVVKSWNERFGKDGGTVILALAVANDDLVIAKVNILDAQAQAFHEAQSASI